jgi:hypothetical protein
METRIEKKRARIFRITAWAISLAFHLLILYILMTGIDHKEANATDVAVVTSEAKIQNKP